MRGFSVPAALREYERASTCTRFIDALEGRTDTMTFFREFVDEYCKKNSSLPGCIEDLSAKNPRIFLLEFGWGLCANSYTSRNNADGVRTDRMRAQLVRHFRQLFKVKTLACED